MTRLVLALALIHSCAVTTIPAREITFDLSPERTASLQGICESMRTENAIRSQWNLNRCVKRILIQHMHKRRINDSDRMARQQARAVRDAVTSEANQMWYTEDTSASCGDGTVDDLRPPPGAYNEDCDDGNTEPGDGCSEVCDIEEGWVCTGSPSVCSPP